MTELELGANMALTVPILARVQGQLQQGAYHAPHQAQARAETPDIVGSEVWRKKVGSA